MTLLATQKNKMNWNRPNESAIRWRVLKLFDQGDSSSAVQYFAAKDSHYDTLFPKLKRSLAKIVNLCFSVWIKVYLQDLCVVN